MTARHLSGSARRVIATLLSALVLDACDSAVGGGDVRPAADRPRLGDGPARERDGSAYPPPPPSELGPPDLRPITDRPRVDMEWVGNVTCATPAPAGATLAAPFPKYSKGSCPLLVPGKNSIPTAGGTRAFILVAPAAPLPGESYPLLFLWHWLKGSAQSFLDKGQLQQATDQQRFVAIIPEAKGDLSLFGLVELPWPITTVLGQPRVDEELAFFDDMLACAAQQYTLNKECVSVVGVSAGALFAAQLATARSQHLSSLISLSGGVGSTTGVTNLFIWPWTAPPHKLPAIVLWGGAADSCALLNFQLASQELEKRLIAGGHFFLECVHNCGHGEPPLVPPAGKSKYSTMWDFAFRHPFWLKPGQSPYLQIGVPPDIPWCSIGAGSATLRSGPCDKPGCPI